MHSGTALHRLVKPPFPLRGAIRQILLIILGAAVLLAGAGIGGVFFAAPWAVDRALTRFAAQDPERSASVASVRFNPLTLSAELTSLRLEDGRAQSTFSASAIIVEFRFRSLLERRLDIESILIASPDLALGSLAQILDFGQSLSVEKREAVSIGRLEISDGRLATTTAGNQQPLQFSDISVSLTDFDGRAEPPAAAPGQLRLRATTAGGAQIGSDGFLAAGLGRAAGTLTLAGLDLETVRLALARSLPLRELSGSLDLNGDYVLSAPLNTPVLELMDVHAEIRDAVLAPASGFMVRADQINAAATLAFAPADGAIPASGRIEITDAKLAFSDERMSPPQTFEFATAAVLLSVDPRGEHLSINLGGTLTSGSTATVTARIQAGAVTDLSLTLNASDVPAEVLSRYSAQALGRGVSSGRADIDLEYSLSGPRVSGNLNLVVREFAFAADGDASLDLAAALLVNADGVIGLNLPFAGNSRSARDAAADALRARLAGLTETPFDAVAPLIAGDVDAVRVVPFVPGDAALSDRAQAAATQLAEILTARPRLGLRVHGGYDAAADRDALARQQIQLHVLLATAGPSASARPQAVDFSSARAQDVLDEFARERLPAQRIEAIAALFECEQTIALLCRRAYYAALFDALVAGEDISDRTLNRLGRFRAQSIVEALTQRGIAATRIEVVTAADVVDSPFGIGVPVDLTVALPR